MAEPAAAGVQPADQIPAVAAVEAAVSRFCKLLKAAPARRRNAERHRGNAGTHFEPAAAVVALAANGDIAPSGNIVINDTISVRGGNGGQADFGDGGAGGGGGQVIVNALPLGNITANLGLFDLIGGQPGPSLGNGFPGEGGQDGAVTITP